MLKDYFFRDSASRCRCCVLVVVAAHDSTSSSQVHCCRRHFYQICLGEVVKCNFCWQIFYQLFLHQEQLILCNIKRLAFHSVRRDGTLLQKSPCKVINLQAQLKATALGACVEEFRFCGAASRVDKWIIIPAYQVISNQRVNLFNFMLPALLCTANWVNGSSHQQILETRASHVIVKKGYT